MQTGVTMAGEIPIVIPAQPHALPYRVVLEEYRARRGQNEYVRATNQWLNMLPAILVPM
jgi:hypothetical protein